MQGFHVSLRAFRVCYALRLKCEEWADAITAGIRGCIVRSCLASCVAGARLQRTAQALAPPATAPARAGARARRWRGAGSYPAVLEAQYAAARLEWRQQLAAASTCGRSRGPAGRCVLAFRVTPGSFGALEVRGDQRVLLPISASGAAPVELELASRGLHREDTADHRGLGARRGGEPVERHRSRPAAARRVMRRHGTQARAARSRSRSSAVSVPPHTQPVSSPTMPARRTSPSADQCPKMTRASRLLRSRVLEPGTQRRGRGGGAPLIARSMRPSAVHKRMRV